MTFSLRKLLFPALLVLSLGLVGCGSSTTEEVDDLDTYAQMDAPESDGLDIPINADSDSGRAGNLATVNFPFDSSTLTDEARRTLQRNVEFLQDNPNIEIQVEGHCDERGGVQYNLALGERRAKSVRDYMVAMGISSSRISTISFGKERPIAFGHNESAWGQNRRANFVVTAN